MSTYTPILEPATIQEVVKPAQRVGIANYLPKGTHIRATLGESVIVGTTGDPSPYALIMIKPDMAEDALYGFVEYPIYPESGWTFEVLDAIAPDRDNSPVVAL